MHNRSSKPKSKTVYTNFLGFLVKNGNKLAAKKTIDTAFIETSRQAKLPLHLILIKVFSRINSFVETKKIKIKRSTHTVPFGITSKRRSYLVIKWLMEVVAEDKSKVSTSKKLSTELLNILKDKSSKTVKKKDLNINQAISNRSNIHYRW
jgi:ribosomal protein S7|tara:strand:+ start:1404 stop:1853 length:450 start_codon:yes stop_codon:yes gene_type:complete